MISNALPHTEQASANTQTSQCSSECYAVGDPTPFQPIDAATIGRTRHQQGQKAAYFALFTRSLLQQLQQREASQHCEG